MGKHVLIIGAARQGQALARHLAAQGARVVLNDKQPDAQMKNVVDAMATIDVRCVFGSHPLELLDSTELVAISGGVPLSLPMVVEAMRRGIQVTNDTQIFLEEVEAPVIGITGSAGKTTTTTLVGKMAELAVKAPRRAWVGGNIGLPLVDHVQEIQPEDLVILEISSFQLEQMTISPHIAAVLNITPNHLDRHGTMEAYQQSKARILQFQGISDIALLNREDGGSWSLLPMVKGELVTFGKNKPQKGVAGTYVEGTSIQFTKDGKNTLLFPVEDIQIRGEHNLLNVLAATAIGCIAGIDPDDMHKAVREFRGVEHRLEWIRKWQSTDWYNDSIATAPERTMAALKSFSEPIVLLLGGRDKDLPWEELATYIHQRVKQVILFGEAAEKIQLALNATQLTPGVAISRVPRLHDAILKAAELAKPGDVVLLSPGGTSFDEFVDFEERGRKFKQWVEELP